MADGEQLDECRTCACRRSKVLRVRQANTVVNGKPVRVTRRKRECEHCHRIYYTTERHA